MRVGFAGLGRMGAPMARNLAAAGFELTVWNRSRDKADDLAAEIGCGVADSPRDLADRAEVVFTMLADDASSDAVHSGPDGLFAGQAARWLVEMGTMSPDHIATLVSDAPGAMQVLDAPVSGSTQAAEGGQLMLMLGGTEAETAELAPLFDAISKRAICLGARGAGAVMKLAVNSLIHGLNQTLAEAMTLARAAGIPSEAAFDVIEASAAAAPMLSYRRPLYLHEADHAVTFTVALARKDMEVTAALAERYGVAMPQGRVTLQQLQDAEAAGYSARDMASMLTYMKEETS